MNIFIINLLRTLKLFFVHRKHEFSKAFISNKFSKIQNPKFQIQVPIKFYLIFGRFICLILSLKATVAK